MTKKFRVWSDYHKKFVVQGVEFGLQRLFEDFSVSLMGKWQRNEDYEMPLRISDYKIQQWTGLTDSQGVEIYEGDIIKASLLEEEIIRAVKYSREYAAFLLGENALWQDWLGNSKIIGNIFQTPELLEKC